MPKISLEVVINGPVAMAGSMPRLWRKIGIKVPMIPANKVTDTKESEMAIEVKMAPFQTQVTNS